MASSHHVKWILISVICHGAARHPACLSQEFRIQKNTQTVVRVEFIPLYHVMTDSASQWLLVCRSTWINYPRPALLTSHFSHSGWKKLFDRNKEASPCNYIWSRLHMSLPQSLSCSLILDAGGNLFLIYKFTLSLFLLFSSGGMNLRRRIRHPVLVYLEERDKCGLRLFQGTHINHAWEGAQGVWRGGEGGWRRYLSAERSQLSLTSGTVKTSPSHHRQLGPAALACVSGDGAAACHSRAGSEMLSRGVGLTTLQRVNLYPTVTPDPDPATKVCRETRNTTGKMTTTGSYATKETIYLGYALPSTNEETIKPTPFSYFLHRKQVLNWN